MIFGRTTRPKTMPSVTEALPGRSERPYDIGGTHAVLGHPLEDSVPEGYEVAYFALGCFWGAEKRFWETPGVWSTASGYAGGVTPNPTYEEVCGGRTGHAETVRVVFDPARVSYAELLATFWEAHDPTQGYRQGNDIGTQYRSAIFTTSPEQQEQADASRAAYLDRLHAAGFGDISTEIVAAPTFYYAEDYHQQYLHKVPSGYCPDHGTGVACPINFAART